MNKNMRILVATSGVVIILALLVSLPSTAQNSEPTIRR
jgi:hypothetical protein